MESNQMNQVQTKKAKMSPLQSMIVYFRFLWLYVLKKKSTWLAPIIFAGLFIFISIIIANFTGESQSTNLRMFTTITSMFSIIFFSIIGMIKGLNIFQDPSEDGIEILIVSKPIERWQIVFVKFFLFHLLGLAFFLISILIFTICAAILGLNAFEVVFNQISVGTPLINWFAYMLFGTIGILLSIKFNSKTILSIGMVTMVALTAADTFVNSFGDMFITSKGAAIKKEISGDSSPFAPAPYSAVKDKNNGNVTPFIATSAFGMIKNIKFPSATQFDISLMYDDAYAKKLENIWNEAADNTWLNQFITFINPVSAFNKLGTLGYYYPQSDSSRSQNEINENDFSFTPKIVDANDFTKWKDHVLNGIDLSDEQNPNYIQFKIGNGGTLFRAPSGDDTNWVKEINSVKQDIFNFVKDNLQSVTGGKENVVSTIKTSLNKLKIDWTKFEKLELLNGDQIQENWTSNDENKANFVFYLAQLVLTNMIFEKQDEHALTQTKDTNASNNAFFKEVEKSLLDLDNSNIGGSGRPPGKRPFEDDGSDAIPGRPMQGGSQFFGESTNQHIVKKSNAKLVQLVPSQTTATWAIVLTWIVIMGGLSAGTMYLYFKEDFR